MRLQERYNLFLYIDDAHGISILGAQGEGFARGQLPDELGPRTIVAPALGKGFGAYGGVLMLGSREQEDVVRRYAQPYDFSAAPNLAAVGPPLASSAIHTSQELPLLKACLHHRIDTSDHRIHTPQPGTTLPIPLDPPSLQHR